MNYGTLITTSFLVLALISSCTATSPNHPTALPSSTSTHTPIPSQTSKPTITPIPITNTPGLPGMIIGTVFDLSERPLENIVIKLFKKNNYVTETKTDTDGNFIFENVPPGQYVLNYDYFPDGGFTLHYYGEEFVVESEMTTQLDYVINVKP